ncbi:uncharacterized protein LOC120086256 [Benincasa hispida]|uniref:uncharacterized protein LOC120086256 n=1 Tax=Benincasa hispida TaxID=102211 RepID=UPI001901DA85|nr:uncharacterized protein LOC120086256 [Benincasa hispida]
MAKPNVCCSIELEPKTLNQGQLHQAREVAADVVQKLEPSEASLVLIDIVERFKTMNYMLEGEGDSQPSLPPPPSLPSLGDIKEERGRCQCFYVSTESPNQLQLVKEPLSAPF